MLPSSRKVGLERDWEADDTVACERCVQSLGESLIHSFTHSLIKQILSTYCVPNR